MMVSRGLVVALFLALVLSHGLVQGLQRHSRGPQMPPQPSNVRRLLGSARQVRALETDRRGRSDDSRGPVVLTDTMPLVLAQVVLEMGGGPKGPCHVLIYHDPRTAAPKDISILQAALSVPVILVDVTKMRFPLITKARRKVPLLDLLSHRPDTRCRLLVAWSSSNYQRGLLLMARAEPGLLRNKDTLILVVRDQRLDRFLPQLRRRVLVKQQRSRAGRGRRALRPPRFLVEGVCEVCQRYSLTRLGEWQYPSGWRWGGAKPNGWGLSGSSLTVTYTPSVPNIFPINDGTLRLEGVELRLLQYAAKALNFSYRLTRPKDGEWGRLVNRSWTGKVGEVVRGRADIAVGGLVFTEPRSSAVQYSVLFHNELWGIVCPLSARLPVWPYIMFPFRADAAPSIFTLLVVLHVMAFLVMALVGSNEPQGPQDPLLESLLRVIRAGISLYLRLMACLYFWNLYYCLMKPKYEPPVDTSAALLRSGYNWGVVSGTTITGILSTSQYMEHRDLAQSAIPLDSIREGFQRLREEGICLVGVPKRYARATIATRHSTECGEPGLQVSTEDLNSVKGGWLFPKESSLTPHINAIIRRLQTFGLLEHWRKELHELFITRAPRDLPCLNPPLAPLTILDLRLAFLLLIVGWGMACTIFLYEQLRHIIMNSDGQPKFVRRDTAIQDVMPRSPNRFSNWQDWLRNVLSPVPSVNMNFKEAAFRRQLNLIFRDLWGLTP